jgi:putative nucleotidyltransferase with HDIG domain
VETIEMSPPQETVAKSQVYLEIDRRLFLPPSFELIPRLLLLLDNPEADSEELAEVIRVDAALTADVLRISNSAYFSGRYRIETVREAILRVGLREIYRIVMRVIASPVFQASQRTSFPRLDLWKHSFAAAVAAGVLARKSGEDGEVAFTAALLHDIGKLLLAQAHGQKYVALIEKASEESRGISALEERLFHIDHAAIGGRLLAQWNFPEKVSAAVGAHHNPFAALRPCVQLSAITYLANVLAYRIGRGGGFPEYAVAPDGAVLRVLDFSPENLDEIEQEVAEEFAKEESRFR